jgi:TRAM1-like protein
MCRTKTPRKLHLKGPPVTGHATKAHPKLCSEAPSHKSVHGSLTINLVRTLRASESNDADFSAAIAVNLLCLLLLLRIAFPAARYYTRKFSHLSYYNEKTGVYAVGRDDSLFVCFWIVLLTGLRAGVIDYILIPVAAWAGIEKQKARVRFAEQAWLICHHGTSWLCGIVSLWASQGWSS